jgi:hypothetical protein
MNTDFHAASAPLKTSPGQPDGEPSYIYVSPRKVGQYLGMFAVMTAVYYWYFVRGAKADACNPVVEITSSTIAGTTLGIFIFASWPFALMAAFDRNWRSRDAGNVFLAAYLATNLLWYHNTGCGFCIYAAAFKLVPYTFCAWMAHELGTLRYRLRLRK